MSDGEPPGQPCPRAEMLDAMAASGMPVEVPDTIPSQISDMSPEDGEAMRAELIQLANDMLLARVAAVNATTNAAAAAAAAAAGATAAATAAANAAADQAAAVGTLREAARSR